MRRLRRGSYILQTDSGAVADAVKKMRHTSRVSAEHTSFTAKTNRTPVVEMLLSRCEESVLYMTTTRGGGGGKLPVNCRVRTTGPEVACTTVYDYTDENEYKAGEPPVDLHTRPIGYPQNSPSLWVKYPPESNSILQRGARPCRGVLLCPF